MKGQHLLFALLLMQGCKPKKVGCTFSSDELLRNNANKVFIPDKIKGHIMEINDKGVDSIKGGVYFFYENGRLKGYNFFENMQAYTYNEQYDETGQLIKIIGKPLVDTKIREVNADSAFIRLYFFSLQKTYKKLSVSINDTLKLYLDLKNDTLYSNMKIASFGLNTKGLSQIEIHFSVDYKNECTNQNEIVRDTLSLIKNPKLNFTKKHQQQILIR
jgi:hypothetical protein